MSEKCEFTPEFPYEVAQAAVSWQFDITLTVFHIYQKLCFKKARSACCCPRWVCCIFGFPFLQGNPLPKGTLWAPCMGFSRAPKLV